MENNTIDDIYKRMDEAHAAKQLEITKTRKEMLAVLRTVGVTKVKGNYEGYGDEGNIESVTLEPENTSFKDENRTLSDLIWDIAYNTNRGFEIDDGGNGELTWDIVSDKINIIHNNFYTESTTSTHKDV